MGNQAASIDDLFAVIEQFGNFYLTKNGGLIGAIALPGKDPDGLSSFEFEALSAIAQTIYYRVDSKITITQYYTHYDGVNLHFRDRDNSIADNISKRRQQFLNSKNLNMSNLVHYFEIEPTENLNRLNIINRLKHLLLSPVSKKSRDVLLNDLTNSNQILLELDTLTELSTQLQDTINEVIAKWKGIFECRQLSLQEIWAHMRFLASLNPFFLENGLLEDIPDSDCDILLSPGDVSNVIVQDMDVIKIVGPTNIYCRIASVRQFSNQRSRTIPGLWSNSDKSPTQLRGNYVIMNRWKALSEFEKGIMFHKKHNELSRQQLSLGNMLTGTKLSPLEKQASTKVKILEKIEELNAAEAIADKWGHGHSHIVIFGTDPKEIKRRCVEMEAAAANSRISIFWESVSVEQALKTFQPGQRLCSERNLLLTSSQFGAASLIYRSSPGQPYVPDLSDEALYVFTSKSNEPFYYSPVTGGRSLVIAVGRIRSGKTFFKNTVATHFQKYGGLYRAVDIDPGSEPIAQTFCGTKGVFRVSNDAGHGANVFASFRGDVNASGEEQKDTTFRAHLTNLLISMLKANDSPEMQVISKEEQKLIDEAIEATLRLPDKFWTLNVLVNNMPADLRIKFQRWVRRNPNQANSMSGRYAHIFDADEDSIGNLHTPLAVFNLQALKSNKAVLEPIQLDLLYRITQAFEDPKIQHKPKVLDWDEAHDAIKNPVFCDYIVTAVRTWGKWNASIQLWTQSPEELIKAPGWNAIRGAATTFLFMADQNLDRSVYREAFPFITDGELDAIRNLIPQKQAYIIQPDLGISKVINVEVEPEQYVINTSHGVEVKIRNDLIAQYGFEKGIQLAIERINEFRQQQTDQTQHQRAA